MVDAKAEARAFADELGKRAHMEQVVMHHHARTADKIVARFAELEAENARLTKQRDYWQSQHDERTRQLGQSAEALSRTGAVKVLDPDMPAQEMRLHMGEMTAQEMRTARAAIRWANTRLSALEPAAPEGQQPVAEAVEPSGNPGELIDKMADAIRGDTILDDTPWETLSEDRKVGWRGDAERALAVVKEHLTARRPTEQAVTEAMVEAACRAHWPGDWPGDRPGNILAARRHDMRAALKAAMEAGR